MQISLALQNPLIDTIMLDCALTELEERSLERLFQLSAAGNNFAQLRKARQHCSKMIQFFGLYLGDLAMLKESKRSDMTECGAIVDWPIMENVARVIKDFMQTQDEFHHSPTLHDSVYYAIKDQIDSQAS